MLDFKTYEQAAELFGLRNYLGPENCIFVAVRDQKANGAAVALRAALGPLGALIACKLPSKDALERVYFDGLLINFTGDRLAFIPLQNAGMNANAHPEKMRPVLSRSFCIGYNEIEKITVKDASFVMRYIKSLRVYLKNGKKIQVLVRSSEKAIPYQERNFEKFSAFAARYE